MGLVERANILAKMRFTEKTDLYLRIQRLLSPKLMGELFSNFVYNFKNNNFEGFK